VKMDGSRRIDAPPAEVWRKLNDTETLQRSIAGCQSLEADGEYEYKATLKVKVGPVSAPFKGRLSLSNVVPGESYTLTFNGEGAVAGFARGAADVALDQAGNGTLLRYTVNARVGGKIAQVGQRLVDAAARQMAEEFFARFEAELENGAGGPQRGGAT
jgi:uncharacterized protein